MVIKIIIIITILIAINTNNINGNNTFFVLFSKVREEGVLLKIWHIEKSLYSHKMFIMNSKPWDIVHNGMKL